MPSFRSFFAAFFSWRRASLTALLRFLLKNLLKLSVLRLRPDFGRPEEGLLPVFALSRPGLLWPRPDWPLADRGVLDGFMLIICCFTTVMNNKDCAKVQKKAGICRPVRL